MPDEQVGLGPAAIENPEAKNDFEPVIEPNEAPSIPEAEPVVPEAGAKYEKLLTAVAQSSSTTPASEGDAKGDVAHISTLENETEKVEQLVKLAEAKGLPHAVKVAEGLKDYYALDMFHDTLVDDLYDRLIQQGLITKE